MAAENFLLDEFLSVLLDVGLLNLGTGGEALRQSTKRRRFQLCLSMHETIRAVATASELLQFQSDSLVQ